MPIRVMLVDDSETILTLLQELISRDPEFLVVGTACNGARAVALARACLPDLIIMDLLMPELDGIAAIRQLAGGPRPSRIVALTTLSAASISFRALEAGAVEVLQKPTAYYTPQGQEAFRHLLARLKILAQAGSFPEAASPRPPAKDAGAWRPRGIAVAASTGGPLALKALFHELPSTFPVPILVVQHITEGFGAAFADWLQGSTPLEVVPARSGLLPQPGHIYVAPDGHHLLLSGAGRLLLSDEGAVNSHRPSADLLFESVGKAWRDRALGMILTGMGRDGTAGLGVLKAHGGRCLAQDKRTCQIFGMPAAAIEAGLADQVMSLDELAYFLLGLCPGCPGD